MRFDLVDLRLFIAVAESGAITKGAEAANMALASASARINGMEATLGVPLLTRQRRGIVLTAAGRALLHHARIVTHQIERMKGDLTGYATGLKGEVRVMANTASLVAIVPAALQAFLSAHPEVDVDLEERTSGDIVAAVGEGRVDLGVVSGAVEPHGLETRILCDDRLVVLLPSSHPAAAHRSLAFQDLLEEPFVGLRDGALHGRLSRQAAQLGSRLRYRVALRNYDAITRMVAAGVGIAIMPVAAVPGPRDQALTAVPLSDAWARRQLTLCARSFGDLPRHARALADEIVRQGQRADE